MSRMALADRRNPWRLIEVRHLTALAAIAREGTLGDAALSLGYVQSAISGQLAMLERLVGAQLVERSRGHGNQELTAAGVLLLAHSQDILAELEAACAGVAEAARDVPTGLRVAVAPALADGLVGPVLSTALDEQSATDLARVDALGPEEAVVALLADEVDVALIGDPMEHSDVAVAEIGRYPMVLAYAPSRRALHGHDPLPLAALADVPLVVWREGADPSRVEGELEATDARLEVAARADTSATALALAADGVGAALVPTCALSPGHGLAVRRLEAGLSDRYAGVAWSRAHAGDERVRRFVALACALRASDV
jgi:DNA-binding transcriptional LysR family regulator